MVTGKEDILMALTDVYIMEKETKDFYSLAAHRANEVDAKAAFREMEYLKHMHIKYVQFLFTTIQMKEEIVSFEDFKSRTDVQPDEGWEPVKEHEMHFGYTDDTDILINALEIEAKAHELYGRLAETVEDSSAKAVFREMVTQEDRHIDFLRNIQEDHIEE